MKALPASIEAVATRADKTIKITIGTQELPASEAGELMALSHKLGWFVFQENKIEGPAIPKEDAKDFRVKKSASQRLHSVLYIYWKECTKQDIDYNTYYERWMERMIQDVKDLLPKK